MTWLTSEPDPHHHPGMNRRRFLVTSVAGAIAAPLAAVAQQRLPAVPPVCYAGEGGTIVPAGHGEHWARGTDRRKLKGGLLLEAKQVKTWAGFGNGRLCDRARAGRRG
jgi:hypothetical protein